MKSGDGKQLTGKELVDFVEEHRKEFEEDGDALCVAAGYGKDGADGSTQCNLPAFVNELGQATDLNNYEVLSTDDTPEMKPL